MIREEKKDLQNDHILKKIYDHKFNQIYHLGLINLIDRPANSISQLKAGEEIPGRKRILAVIKQKKPKVVCFVGKTNYEKFIGSKITTYGWKSDIFSSKIYVMHSPLHGLSSVRVRELKKVKEAAGL